MSLHNKIKTEIKQAMLTKHRTKLEVTRGLVAAFTNELVAKKRMPQDELSDDEAMEVIKRSIKQRKESIRQFEAGARQDLVLSEKQELNILETYLPEMMSSDEIRRIAEQKKNELNMTDKSKIGQLIGAVMKETKGRADGNDVKKIIETLF